MVAALSLSPASCPAVLVAAAASGRGKTTVAAALARLHARRGRRVRAFKCGPDFLDPHWLQLASGAPVHQLDLWMNGEEDCRARLYAAARDADLLVVEGVMGLFDGEPSAADLARRFGLPVLAVVDASAMAGTFGALAHGLRTYRDGLRWAGVLANQVAGDRHADMLRAGLRDGDAWMGALPRNPAFTLAQRHLGLVPSGEQHDALARLDAAADALASTPLGTIDTAPAAWWTRFSPATEPPASRLLAGRTLAVARDAAFCFLYDANLQTLERLGARVVFFSPLANEPVPSCDAVWLPGGYPELHAAALGAARATRDSLATHAAAGRPVWAECGGMMALFEQLADADGAVHAMWGLLPGRTVMNHRLAALGPQQLAIGAGVLRGHTFHHSTCHTPLAATVRTRHPTRPSSGEAVYVQGAVRASYFHAWFASSPAATAALFFPGSVQ